MDDGHRVPCNMTGFMSCFQSPPADEQVGRLFCANGGAVTVELQVAGRLLLMQLKSSLCVKSNGAHGCLRFLGFAMMSVHFLIGRCRAVGAVAPGAVFNGP